MEINTVYSGITARCYNFSCFNVFWFCMHPSLPVKLSVLPILCLLSKAHCSVTASWGELILWLKYVNLLNATWIVIEFRDNREFFVDLGAILLCWSWWGGGGKFPLTAIGSQLFTGCMHFLIISPGKSKSLMNWLCKQTIPLWSESAFRIFLLQIM